MYRTPITLFLALALVACARRPAAPPATPSQCASRLSA